MQTRCPYCNTESSLGISAVEWQSDQVELTCEACDSEFQIDVTDSAWQTQAIEILMALLINVQLRESREVLGGVL
jgi:transcription elongation factor Elf1